MENKLQKRYGLFTAICMVVGIVIGSGVFFKAQNILNTTGGNLTIGVIAWILGGVVMILCMLAFAVMAQKFERCNGVVDYAEATVGHKYAYVLSWFETFIYYPGMTSALAWLSARYTLVFITSSWPNFPLVIPAAMGGCVIGPECLALAAFYMAASYAINALSPKLAGKFQTSTTVIKLIPLCLMAVVGIIVGLVGPNHMLVSNFGAGTVRPVADMSTMEILFKAVCATVFAYEGWVIATSINSELKNSKRNLPFALMVGGAVIIGVYVFYFLGVAGGAKTTDLMDDGATVAFTNVFGNVLGNILNLFVAVSCMGTLNGLMVGQTRGMYTTAMRKEGPADKTFAEVSEHTNMAHNSAVIGLVACAAWLLYFYLACLAETWKGAFVFDSTELPIVAIYAMYIPMFIMFMIKEKGESAVRRFLIPALALLGSAFMVACCIIGHKMENVWFLIVFAVITLIGMFFYKGKCSLAFFKSEDKAAVAAEEKDAE